MNTQRRPVRTGDLLLVEDTPSLQMLYRTILRKAGYPPICASTGAEAVELFTHHLPRVVLMDLMLPDTDGLTVMAAMLQMQPDTRVIVMSASGTVVNAVEATRRGAHDFLVKPLGDLRMVTAVAHALSLTSQIAARSLPVAQDLLRVTSSVFLGQSPAIKRVLQQVDAVAHSLAPVFLLGANGTGKCACAELIHSKSARADRKMVIVNCRGTEADEIEHTLFSGLGQDGAIQSRGALMQAQGSTLYLVNPHDMPLALQDRLLKIIGTGYLPASGDSAAQPFDNRLICASDTDPQQEVANGTLREELFYRLFVIPFHMPSLDDRSADIPVIAEHMLSQIAQQEGRSVLHLEADAIAALARQSWPGNLRQLANLLRQAVVLNAGPALTHAMIEPLLAARRPARPDDSRPENGLAGLTMAEIERRVIEACIARHDGSVPQAARELDLAPSTIYRKRDAWGTGTA